MRLTRPRRLGLAMVLGTAVMLATLFVLGWRRSDVHFGPALSSVPAMREAVQSWHTRGVTGWLIVQEDEAWGAGGANRMVQRSFRVEPSGLMTALAAMVGVTMFLLWSGRWLVQRPVLRGACDGCGYSLAGLAGGVCPECGERVSSCHAQTDHRR